MSRSANFSSQILYKSCPNSKESSSSQDTNSSKETNNSKVPAKAGTQAAAGRLLEKRHMGGTL
jgi:hypothetical protein